jgi:hypothetical protein
MAVRKHSLFRRLDHPAPDAAKGGCYVSYGNGPCVDTGVLIDFEGTLTLSINTIKELAEVAGFSVNEEGEALEVENAEQAHRITELEAQLQEANDQLDAVGLAVAHAAQVRATPEPPAKPKPKPKAEKVEA